MKTIFYLLLTGFLCLTPGFSIQKTPEYIILHPVDGRISTELLTQSGRIISGRLKTYGLEATVSVISDKNQIKVQIPENINISEIEGLLTTKGNPGFYETLTVKEIADLSKSEFKTSPSEARLGFSTFEDTHVVDSVRNILRSVNLLSDYKLLWGLKNSESLTCLYAVKNNPALTRADIESINSSKDSKTQSITIGIRFKSASAKIWAAVTKENLNKPVAIVIDDKVLYTPVVKSPIENGLCEITGNITEYEINYFMALVNNDALPVNLTLK